MRIDYILADDWAVIYVDGEVFTQDHSISDYRWTELVEKAFYRSLTSSEIAPRIDIRRWEIDYGYLDTIRYFPQLFDEIPEDELEEL